MRKITILITDEQHKRLKTAHKYTECSISEQIRKAIDISVPDFIEPYKINIYINKPESQKCVHCLVSKTIDMFDEPIHHITTDISYQHQCYNVCIECADKNKHKVQFISEN